MWSRLDPLTPLEEALSRRPPARTCCGFWSLDKGVRWGVVILIFEALVQLGLSFLRPPRVWVLSPYVFICLMSQDVTRLFMLGTSLWTLRAFRRGRGVILALRILFRTLVFLVFLEPLELFLKFVADRGICEDDKKENPEAVGRIEPHRYARFHIVFMLPAPSIMPYPRCWHSA